ncbi:SpoIVB peptidase. Serine peptidase. MEROPS family S55 [Natronincola peptidivorans]|uniref:SpoIVB peptidase. Serine peptidase. MEROPS family S55 n=1 Tax=Natronincola peptidivorans TaxID=426128 RepID=A0A1H9YN87_9FIRM|nr:SpoIVB peptidase. Serine peptidase. MEROPS family S55 [Natronincola peptidivorans]
MLINKIKYKKYLSYIMCFTLIFTAYVLFIEITGGLDKEYNISIGDNYTLNQRFPLFLSTSDTGLNSIIQIEKLNQRRLNLNKSFHLKTVDKGTTNFQLKVFGLVPYRNIRVNVVPQIEVIPGGHSIGVRLNTKGVLVVGTAQITDKNGNVYNLAETAGIKIGDSLIAINNIKVNNAEHVGNLIQNSRGEALNLTLKRDTKEYSISIEPVQSLEDQQYRLGLWVRDKTAGVGTMTFNHPETNKFGALGHAITDIDTGNILSIKNGEVIKSRVVSIQQGKRGKPGEIRGIFYDVNEPLGKLEKNTDYGVYGELINVLDNEIYNKPIPIAYQHEINEGPAHILTTVDTNRIEKYEIEITRINPQARVDSKSMIIKVTDKELLEKTGGIVQGMSGSPIIQNEKLVGAVTHVLINDPTKGYGIFIEWMIEESGIFDKKYKNVVEN